MLRPNSYDTEGGESEKRKGDERGKECVKGMDLIPRKNIEEGARRQVTIISFVRISRSEDTSQRLSRLENSYCLE